MENRLPLPRHLPAVSGKVAAGALIVALAVSGVAVYRYRAAQNAAAVSYTTAPVTRGSITDAVTGTGPIAAANAVPLNFKNSGKVAEIDVNVGDQVKAGQVLAKLDTSDLQAQLQQAQANLANAQASYNKLVAGATPQALASAQAAIDSANTNLANAQKALVAAQDMAAKDIAQQQQAVANAQQSLNDVQRTAQALPAVIAQQIQQAKDKLYADQVADDAAVARGSMTPQQRQAALDADQAAIDQANASAQQQIVQSQQTVSTAQQNLKTAQANLASAQAKDNQSIQQAQASVDSAAASVKTAQASYNNTAAPPTQADLDAAQAQINAQQANVQLAQNNLDAAVLVAPSDGTVTAINGAVGQWLAGGSLNGSAASSASGAAASSSSSSTNSNFIDLTSLSGLQVTAQVNEADISRVQIGQPVTFTVDAYPNRTFTGKVAIIQPLGQNTQNVVSYTVTSTIDPVQNATLLPGMTATENIIINQVQNALEVPMSALTYARTHLQGQFSGGGGGAQGQGAQAKAQGQGNAQAQQGAGANQAQAGRAAQGGQGAQAKPGGEGGQARAAGQGAQFEQPNGPGVLFLMENGKPTLVRVQFGPSDGRVVQVVSGVNEGDVVVTGGGPAVATASASGKPGGGAFFGFGPKPGG
jgi:HlyD family secretion protein